MWKVPLVDNWVIDLKRAWSVRLAAMFAVVAGVLTASPVIAIGLIDFLPRGTLRIVIAVFVAVVVFVIPVLTKWWPQPKMAEAKAEATEAKTEGDPGA